MYTSVTSAGQDHLISGRLPRTYARIYNPWQCLTAISIFSSSSKSQLDSPDPHCFILCCLLSISLCVWPPPQVQVTSPARFDLNRYHAYLKLVGFKDAPPRVRCFRV